MATFRCAQVVWAQDSSDYFEHIVLPGDTWTALAWRYDIPISSIQTYNPAMNRQRQPTIGSKLIIPRVDDNQRSGQLLQSKAGGLLDFSVRHGMNPWMLASINNLNSPFHPVLYRPVFTPVGDSPPRSYPPGFDSLELSSVPAFPGRGLALRARLSSQQTVNIRYAGISLGVFINGNRLVGVVGTGAFFQPGDHELAIEQEGQPLWTQPWRMESDRWSFEQINYTGSAAAITQEEIHSERERLAAIWMQATPMPLWQEPFVLPIEDFLEITSYYGARRSYNGGPYQTYHEGTDFSAYGGTPVYAPAAGMVVIAEQLKARGGAIIIDHGLGIYSGVYHLSEVLTESGQAVDKGQLIGRVGTTGLSTGNHLHWDLLIGGMWIDGLAWLENGLSCWILQGWDGSCETG